MVAVSVAATATRRRSISTDAHIRGRTRAIVINGNRGTAATVDAASKRVSSLADRRIKNDWRSTEVDNGNRRCGGFAIDVYYAAFNPYFLIVARNAEDISWPTTGADQWTPRSSSAA
jgi:hypothetical protein